MPTTVHYPVPPLPDGTSHYREAYPYGPADPSAFHEGLGIQIDAAQIDPYGHALATVPGSVRFLPDETGGGATGTMLLVPKPGASRDFNSVIGSRGTFIFVYRYLDSASVQTAALALIRANVRNAMRSLRDRPPEASAAAFATGGFTMAVNGGDTLGNATALEAIAGAGHALFELQIAFIPQALVVVRAEDDPLAVHALNRLRELLAPAAQTRRLDPMALYASAVRGPGAALTIAPAHVGHPLMGMTTHRTLIEIRDEYDRPYNAVITIESSPPGEVHPDTNASARGTRVVAQSVPPHGAEPTAVTYTISWLDRVFTPLPSGDDAERRLERTLRAPAHLTLQTIYLPLNPLTPDDESGSWFVANNPHITGRALPRYTEGNRITPLIDGLKVFGEYVRALRSVRGPGDAMYFAGFELQDKFALDPVADGVASIPYNPNAPPADVPSSAFIRLCRDAALSGAAVRALIFDQYLPTLPPNPATNTLEYRRINEIGHDAQAILDGHTPVWGNHHQKALVVVSDGSVAFCGGVDIVSNRLDSPNHGAPGPFHDVHAKIEGTAVADIWRVLQARWNEHPTTRIDHRQDPILAEPPPSSASGSVRVQVACTFPPRMDYSFARDQSLQPLNGFLRAVRRAQKYIYIEDQYLFPFPGVDVDHVSDDSLGVVTALREALSRIDYLILVVANYTDVRDSRRRRKFFIQALKRSGVPEEKVHVFYLRRPSVGGGPGEVAPLAPGNNSGQQGHPNDIYVHAKVWIIDDVIAKIGSSNLNRRSLTYDSEMDVIMIDGALDNGARRLAKELRLELWGEHLGMGGPHRRYLEDHKLALQYWLSASRTGRARIQRYDEEVDSPRDLSGLPWDSIWDPDGRLPGTGGGTP